MFADNRVGSNSHMNSPSAVPVIVTNNNKGAMGANSHNALPQGSQQLSTVGVGAGLTHPAAFSSAQLPFNGFSSASTKEPVLNGEKIHELYHEISHSIDMKIDQYFKDSMVRCFLIWK